MSADIRVLIADDHPLIRKGLRSSVEEEADITVVGEAADGEAALALIRKHQPQISILDIDMPKMGGLAVARTVQQEGLKTAIIFLTLHTDEGLFEEAIQTGGKGYILKDSALQEIAVGVRAVAEGRLYVSSAMTANLIHKRADQKVQEQTASGGRAESERATNPANHWRREVQ